MTTRIISSLILATLIAVLPISVASADAPVVRSFYFEDTSVLADCDSFQVVDVYTQNITARRFFDHEGNLVRGVAEVWGTDTYTNSVTGKAYTMSYHNNTIVDYTTDPQQGNNVGVFFRLTVPGDGAAFLQIGTIVIEPEFVIVFQAGPNQFFEGDFEALCAAME